jgi:hypothetical protein
MNDRLQARVQVRQKEPAGSSPERSTSRRSPRGAGPVSPPALENVSSLAPARQSAAQPAFSFSRIPVHPPGGVVQAKLAIAGPGDAYEQEADRVSAHVMRMPEPQGQRACGCGDACSACRAGQPSQGDQRVQASSAAPRDPARGAVPPATGEVSRAPGQPLDTATRAFMESRFGHDFSRVRVHTGGSAAASATAAGARAYTYGSDVFFGAGQYSPGTYEGRGLLAHELAHVVQQRASAPQHPALAGSDAATARAGRAAGQADAAVVRERRVSAIQLKPRQDTGPVQPDLINARTEKTDRIMDAYGGIKDAYGGGSKDWRDVQRAVSRMLQWRDLYKHARQMYDENKRDEATEGYLAMYSDVAQLAQAGLVIGVKSGRLLINVSKGTDNLKPGLNFSLTNSVNDAAAATGVVDEKGKFTAEVRPHGSVQPQVAIVLSVAAFNIDKEITLGILRHEMIHAVHDASALESARQGKSGSGLTTESSEVLGYVEGFMTMFHLRRPAPSSEALDFAWFELLGVVSLSPKTGTVPWTHAARSVQSKALGQLQEYYCHVLLDQPEYRKAFEKWVVNQIGETHKIPDPSNKNDPSPLQVSKPSREDFFPRLQDIFKRNCEGLTTPAGPGRR